MNADPQQADSSDATLMQVKSVSKKFTRDLRRSMIYGVADMARNMIGLRRRAPALRESEFWALQDVSLELRPGDFTAVIGLNGSGKTTLLRVMAGVFPPDSGEITVRGRVGALIALGVGFHPHMTGRENVYLNGSILGMSREEIDENFPRIAEFANLEDFMDAPAATYSSGMLVRLGFAVAMSSDPAILLMDEVMAVSDILFRNRAYRRLKEVTDNGGAIVYVTHDVNQIRTACNRLVWIHQGRVAYDGDVRTGCLLYEEMTRDLRRKNLDQELQKSARVRSLRIAERPAPDGHAAILRTRAVAADGEPLRKLGADESFSICCEIDAGAENIDDLLLIAYVRDDMGERRPLMQLAHKAAPLIQTAPGSCEVSIEIPRHNLAPGVYRVALEIVHESSGLAVDYAEGETAFETTGGGDRFETGFVHMNWRWSIQKL